jgi:hypothetical protein
MNDTDTLPLLRAAHILMTSHPTDEAIAERAHDLLDTAGDELEGPAAGHAKNARNTAHAITVSIRKGDEVSDERLAYTIAEIVQSMEKVRGDE